MKRISVLFMLLISLLPIFVSAQIGKIPNFGSYPEYGDDFLYLANGGYAELADTDVTDIDYTSTSFSAEVIVDTRSLTLADWNVVLGKGKAFTLLYNGGNPGWAIGFSRNVHQPLNDGLQAKVGDGTQQVTLSKSVSGVVHAVMTWDAASKTIELFVNSESVGTKLDGNIALVSIDNTGELVMGIGNSETKRNVLMARWWSRRLSNTDISALYNNWVNNGDDRVPSSVSRNGLHSEWLMDGEVGAGGISGTGYIRDSAGSNHLEMIGNARLELSSGEPLTMIYPDDGASGVDKTVTLKASGGDASFSGGATHPLSYFFQVDTVDSFDSDNLKESGWLPHYGEYRAFLSPSTTYYWRVAVKDSGRTVTTFTPTRSFTTEGRTNWYVKPVGGNYGSEEGTDYDNAWDGLLEVVFGETGVESGDTLHVCGLHYYTVTNDGYIASQGGILVLNGRQYSDSTERITIDGNCPEGEPGIVWGAYRMYDEPWVYEGNNVYSIHLDGCSHPGNMFQDVGIPTNDDYILLTPVSSITKCEATPGSYYLEEGQCRGNLFYVHTTDSSDPTGRIWANRWGYNFRIFDNRYITFKNLKLMATGSGIRSSYPSEYIRWENCELKHGEHGLIDFWDGHHNMEIINCELAWASNGIYLISSTNNSPSNYLIKGNYIHDIGVLPYHQNGDAHCVGVQGGHNGVIEDNICERCGSGPLFYTFTRQELMNTIVRRNLVKDCHNLGGATGYGISTQCNNDARADKSGNKFYQNIVTNCTVGGRFHYEYEQEVFNNVFHNCLDGLASGRNYNGKGAKVKLRNNIFLDNRRYQIRWYSGARNYTLDTDYNIYYPDGPDKFWVAYVGEVDFAGFQATQGVNGEGIRGPHSIVADPMFVDPDNGDFHLRPGSPAIDMGIDLGFTTDLEGTPVPQGTRPDVGAFEYIIGTGCGPADLNCDGSIDIFDLIIVASDFGKTSGFDEQADTDNNSEIDIYDLVFVSIRFT